MHRQTVLAVLAIVLLLTGWNCGGGAAEPSATPPPTNTPQPTSTAAPTATPAPTATSPPLTLSEIDLEPLLVQSGDLPAGLSGAQIRNSLPEMFDDLPSPESKISRQFERDGAAAGGVAVILYEAQADVDTAYATLVAGFGQTVSDEGFELTRETVPDIGEKAEAVTIESELGGISVRAVDVVFVRCHAVVHVRMTGTSSLLDVSSYAERLDERLAPVSCPWRK